MNKVRHLSATWAANHHVEMTPEDILANAIVSEAAIDYINGLLSDDSCKIRQNERFFKSEWYSVLTRLDPDVLMQMCRRHADELKAKGIRVYKVRKKWKQYEDS